MEIKEEIINLIKENLKERCNIDSLIGYLESTDFFEAPASSKFHSNFIGGLAKHSLNVYKILKDLCYLYYPTCPKSTIIICGLFHDLCKTNFYKIDYRNVKIDGVWKQQAYYAIEDSFPIGHGEKSVILLQQMFKLTNEEILAIRWHMGGFDNSIKGGEIAGVTAINKSKLVTLLQTADMISSNILEGDFNDGL